MTKSQKLIPENVSMGKEIFFCHNGLRLLEQAQNQIVTETFWEHKRTYKERICSRTKINLPEKYLWSHILLHTFHTFYCFLLQNASCVLNPFTEFILA